MLLYIITINLYSCKSVNVSQKKKPEMEKFDIVSFNKYKINNMANYTASDGNRILSEDIDSYYFEQIKSNINDPFSFKYRFFKSSLALMSSCQFFYNIPTGEYLEYDQHGKLIIKKDYDSPYLFSINDLIQKMAKEFNTDLMTPIKGIDVARYVDDNSKLPEYSIRIPINESSFRYIVLDGNSGNVKKDVIGHNIE